ncbi:HAMP domain-containing sensor histidine kinase [Actinomadura terrae]|uniref:HAMP domain-containing sensor histidine kinase n=1 Tax=Actinomadura terrae TaxID=604353 RepID=UPI001FA77438|nr:ATP-binding protein [Actinomadura terrae]
MRRSLRVRLLGMSLAVVATALLATYGTGRQLREERASSASLLETDSEIRGVLLTYANDHRSWDGVGPLVRELARRTGRRIALTTSGGEPIADSARGPLPPAPSARIDAADPRTPLRGSRPSLVARMTDVSLAYYGWQLTGPERRRRQSLAERAVGCLRRAGRPATAGTRDGTDLSLYSPLFATAGRSLAVYGPPDVRRSCVSPELYAPSAAAHGLNRSAVERTRACLDAHQLPYEAATDPFGMRLLQPPKGARKDRAWSDCERAARVAAKRSYVAAPARLYLGTSDRFAPFSPDGWAPTVATTSAILLVAGVVTVLAGGRLVRPIVALTAAAQRMAAGDHGVRVPARGGDEVARLAAAFNTMAASVGDSVRQRKALVSDVAHELRTPLANVRSHLEAAQDGVLPLDAALVRSLLEESDLLDRLVSDLQDLALADAGTLRVHPEERDAADIAGLAVAAHRARAEWSGVAVRVHAPPEPVMVRADPARLRQALGNLVSNAVRHTPEGGAVDVAVRRRPDGVVFTVADTGTGMAPEHLPHVFDRFYRADPSRNRATGGSGLGLAIAKHLVEAHGGRIEVASVPGRGSIFTIRLPHGP